jgi:hypothetical protein
MSESLTPMRSTLSFLSGSYNRFRVVNSFYGNLVPEVNRMECFYGEGVRLRARLATVARLGKSLYELYMEAIDHILKKYSRHE